MIENKSNSTTSEHIFSYMNDEQKYEYAMNLIDWKDNYLKLDNIKEDTTNVLIDVMPTLVEFWVPTMNLRWLSDISNIPRERLQQEFKSNIGNYKWIDIERIEVKCKK